VSKPTEAFIGKAISWIRACGVFDTEDAKNLSRTEVIHNVEQPLLSYLRRRPVHPTAWYIYSWSLLFRGEYHKALIALNRGVWALEVIVTSTTKNGNSNKLKIDDLLSLFKKSIYLTKVKVSLVENSSPPLDEIDGLLNSFNTQSTFERILPSVMTTWKASKSQSLRSIYIASMLELIKNEEAPEEIIKHGLSFLGSGTEDEWNSIKIEIQAASSRIAGNQYLFSLFDKESDSKLLEKLLATKSRSVLSIIRLGTAHCDSDTRSLLDATVQDIHNEICSDWLNDEVHYISEFIANNGSDDRLAFLLCLATSLKVYTRCKAGLMPSEKDVCSLKRTLYIFPAFKFGWEVLSAAIFSQLILTSAASKDLLTSTSSALDVEEKISLASKFCPTSDISVSQAFSLYKSLLNSSSPAEYLNQIQSSIRSDENADNKYSLIKFMGDFYLELKMFAHAEKCYAYAVSMLDTVKRDSLETVVIEMHDIIQLAQLYKKTGISEHIMTARSKTEAICSKYPNLASARILLSYLWQVLKKPQKVEIFVNEGKALWSEVLVIEDD
jgi:hypothetical protein